jgi:hypothetical protein
MEKGKRSKRSVSGYIRLVDENKVLEKKDKKDQPDRKDELISP